MAKITLDNCKAPSWTDYPKLARIGADRLFAEAREIKIQMAALKEQLARITPRIQAKLDSAVDADTTSVLYEDLLLTRRKGYTRRSLDKKWAVTKLIAKGVKKSEIDEHTNEVEIEGGVSVRLLGEDDEGGN